MDTVTEKKKLETVDLVLYSSKTDGPDGGSLGTEPKGEAASWNANMLSILPKRDGLEVIVSKYDGLLPVSEHSPDVAKFFLNAQQVAELREYLNAQR